MELQNLEDTLGPARLPTGAMMLDHYLCGGLPAGALSELIVPDGRMAPYVSAIIRANAARQLAFACLARHRNAVQLPLEPNNVLTVISEEPENLLLHLHAAIPTRDLVILWLGQNEEECASFWSLDRAFDRLSILARISHTVVLLCAAHSAYPFCAASIRWQPDPQRPSERWLVQVVHSYFYRLPRRMGPQNQPST